MDLWHDLLLLGIWLEKGVSILRYLLVTSEAESRLICCTEQASCCRLTHITKNLHGCCLQSKDLPIYISLCISAPRSRGKDLLCRIWRGAGDDQKQFWKRQLLWKRSRHRKLRSVQCLASTSDSCWCVVPFCCSLLSAVVHQHLSHYARRVMTWDSSNWATLTLSWIKANHFRLRQKMQSLRTFLLSLEDFAHWNRETLSNIAQQSCPGSSSSYGKRRAQQKTENKSLSFIHSLLQKPPFCRRHLPPDGVFSDECGQK